MKMQTRKGGQAQVWTLFGYSVALMSVFGLGSGNGMWAKVALSLAVMVLAALLANLVSAREACACSAGSRDK